MKRKTIVYLASVIISFAAVATTSVAQAADWDWSDSTTFKDWNGSTLGAPWDINFQVGGGAPSDPAPPKPADGWRLYAKRFTCADYNSGTCTTTSPPPGYYPFFALYNIHTGVLRTYIYIAGNNFTGAQEFHVVVRVPSTDMGLFLHDGDRAAALSQKTAARNEDFVSNAPAYFNKWLIIDREISYDPSTVPNEENIYYHIGAYQQSEVSIGGTFKFTLSSQQRNNQQQSLFDTALSAGSTIKKRLGQVKDAAKAFQEDGNELKSKGDTTLNALGDNLLSVSTLLSGSTGGYIGAAVGAYDVISSFTNIGGTRVSTQYGAGSITLGGTIINAFPVNFIGMGVHKSQHSVASNNSSLDFAGNLGLFSLARPIEFELGQDYFALRDDVYSLIQVNPYSEMILAEVKMLPNVQGAVSWFPTPEICGFPGGVVEQVLVGNNPNYKAPVSLERPPVGRTALCLVRYNLKTETLIDPSKALLFVQWNASGYSSRDPIISTESRVKLYLKFRHNNNPNVFAEFVREYPVSIVKTYCTKAQVSGFTQCPANPAALQPRLEWLPSVLELILN